MHSKFNNLVEQFRSKVGEDSEAALFTFLQDGEEDTVELNRGALDRQARILGGKLQEMGLAGERAALLYPPGLDYITGFFGCLYGNVIAVPAYPPDPSQLEHTLPRLLAIIKNCQAKVILTTHAILSMVEFIAPQYPEIGKINWLASDTLKEDYADAWKEPHLTGESLAFLQYTSGSTGNPKGVQLTHGSLINHLELVADRFGLSPDTDVGICWLPPYHDMGLIGGILTPVLGGGKSLLISPLHFLEKPIRWLKAFSKTRQSVISGGPNFAFELCIKKITPQQRETIDLSHWKLAYTGAEPIRNDTLENFAKAFGPCGFNKKAFNPCYGLAEATLMVTGNKPGQVYRTLPDAATVLVSCGTSPSDQKIRIVDPQTLKLVKDGEIGEIWVHGPSVAKGYWDDPEGSDSTFNNFLNGSNEGPFLRTGDLGFLNQEELFVTGRLKDLIIIRGMNHYPQDIERTLENSHPAFSPGCGAAFSLPVDGEERLILIQELNKESFERLDTIHFPEVVDKVKRTIATYHDLEVYAIAFLAPSTIPRTASRKISRHFCQLAFKDNSLKTVFLWKKEINGAAPAPGQTQSMPFGPEVKEQLSKMSFEERKKIIDTQIRARLFQILGVAQIGLKPNQPLSTLGLDSLMFLELKNEIETSLGIVLSIKEITKPKFGLLDLSKLIAKGLK